MEGAESLFARVLATGAGGSEIQNVLKSEQGQYAVLDVLKRHPRHEYRLLAGLALRDAISRGLSVSPEVKSALLEATLSEKQPEIRSALVSVLSTVLSVSGCDWPEFYNAFEHFTKKGNLDITLLLALALGQCEEARSRVNASLIQAIVEKAIIEGIPETVVAGISLANEFGVGLAANAVVAALQRVLPMARQQTCFDVCKEAVKFVKNTTDETVVEIFQGAMEACVSEELDVQARRASFLVVNAAVMRAPEQLWHAFPVLGEAALKLCEELFDEFCATDNGAAGVNFKFAKFFAKANPESFWPALKEIFVVTSPGRMFGLLLALQQSQKYYRDDLSVLLELLKQVLATKIHSIQELALDILHDMMLYHEYQLRDACDTVFVMIRDSMSRHKALGQVCMGCLIRMLFFSICQPHLCDPISEFIIECLRNTRGVVQNLAAVAVSAFAHEFKERAGSCVSQALPLIWQQAAEPENGDFVTQPRAIEALCLCLRFTPEPCLPYKERIIEAAIKGMHSSDRQMFVSSCWATKNLLKAQIPEMMQYVGPVSTCLTKALLMPLEMKDSIDDSGVSAIEVVKAALDLTITGLRKLGSYIGLDISRALCTLDDRAEEWECKEESIVTLKTLGFFCPSYLPVVLPRLMQRDEVWDYLRAVVNDASDLDMQILQVINRECVAAVKAGEFKAMRPIVALVKTKGFAYSIERILELIDQFKATMSSAELAEVVDIFDALHQAGTFAQRGSWETVIKKALDMLPQCASFQFRPAPIKFLSTLIEEGVRFDDASLLNFLACFCDIMGHQPDGPFYEQTMIEILNTGIVIMLKNPGLPVDWYGLFAALLPFLPPRDTSDCGMVYSNLLKIRTTQVFIEHEDLHIQLFAALVRTLAGTEDHLSEISINASLEAALVRHFLDYLKLNPKLRAHVGPALNGDPAKMLRLQDRCAEFTV